ncbi:MAG TPA: hypothetical protein VFT72_19990 [Opitutaceae bacterium]|nr:hypothetical protein [Opitutaceae bacterium]
MIRPLLLLFVAAATLPNARTQTLNTQSPFMSGGAAGGVDASASSNYELVGIIAGSKQTMVGITDKNSKRSFWIPVGKTSDGVEVVSCDPQKDRAVIRVGGQTQSLAMHAASVTGPAVSNSPVSAAPGGAAARPTTAQAQAQAEQEREARMLVSDLLEISIQQRKAYEESQKKGAASPGVAATQQASPAAPRR